MKKKLILFLILVLGVNCGKTDTSNQISERQGESTEAPASSESAAVKSIVTSIEGKAVIKEVSATEWKALHVKDEVPEGAYVRTGENSSADILFMDKCAVRLKENTSVQIVNNSIKENISKIEVNLDMGRLLHRFENMPAGSEYKISTPAAGAVIRGTKFDISIGEATNVRVLEGKVDVSNAYGAVVVNEKEGTNINKDNAPSSPSQLNQKEIDELLECNLVKFAAALQKTRKIATLAEMRNIAIPLDVWATSNDGKYPNSLKEAELDQYRDNWGQAYRYEVSADRSGFVLISNGPDKIPETEDDLEYRR